MNITSRAMKNAKASLIFAVVATMFAAPVFALPIQSDIRDILLNRHSEAETASLADADLSTPYFDASDYELANYAREDIALGNRGMDSEDLLFGTADGDSPDALATPPADMTFYEDNTTVYLNASGVNIRKYPSLEAEIVRLGILAEAYTRTGINEQWIRVTTSDGLTGYISAQFISETKPTPIPTPTPKPTTAPSRVPYKSTSPAVANTLGESIAAEAQKYLGIRYRSGGADPNSGFDCSGFTWYVFSRYGINTPRGTNSYYNAGIVISYSEIAPGDVIAWDTRKYDNYTSITHVGIYIGNGMMVHASSTNNAVVTASVSQYSSYGCKIISVHRFIKA